MVREDLIEGAVTFLHDPSVASAPLEQRIAFLRSKNLTQEEIDASIARAGTSPTSSPPTQPYQPQYRQPQSQYAYQQQQPYWGQQPPPELPRRDWRDWFIMATITGGVGYALYWTAQRYVYPLIAPPTPPQLEQDKSEMDASFDKAFTLLEQLAKDTTELKDSEKARTERLDNALAEVESVIGRMKEASKDREGEAKRMARELDEMREQIPKAIEREREGTDQRLKDLGAEMKSLKTLVANRMGGGAQRMTPSFSSQQQQQQAPPQTSSAPQTNGTSTPEANNDGAEVSNLLNGNMAEKSSSMFPSEQRSGSSTPYGRILERGGQGAKIPEWQLAAKKRKEEESARQQDASAGAAEATGVGASGTVSEAEAGA